MPGSSPISYVPKFPQKYFLSTKRERSQAIKRELFAKGEVPILVCSPEVWEHPPVHAIRWPSLRRTHLYKDLPYKHIILRSCKDRLAINGEWIGFPFVISCWGVMSTSCWITPDFQCDKDFTLSIIQFRSVLTISVLTIQQSLPSQSLPIFC